LTEEAKQVALGAVAGSVQREEAVTPTEEAQLLGQVYYLLKDDKVIDFIEQKKPEYAVLMTALSHLNRTSNTVEKNARLWKLRLKRAIDLVLMTKPEDDITLGEVAFLDSLYIYGSCAIEDAVNGWRGRLATERIRTYRVETGEKKSKAWWWPFR